jgi:hypothetical protein
VICTIDRDVGRGENQPNLMIPVIVVHTVPIRVINEGAQRRVNTCRLSGVDDVWLAPRVRQVLMLNEAVDAVNVKLETVNYLSMSTRSTSALVHAISSKMKHSSKRCLRSTTCSLSRRSNP